MKKHLGERGKHLFKTIDYDRIIEMAWEDRTPFEAVKAQFNLAENDLIRIMRSKLKPGSFKRWRARVNGRKTKHQHLRPSQVSRCYCPTQYKQRSQR